MYPELTPEVSSHFLAQDPYAFHEETIGTRHLFRVAGFIPFSIIVTVFAWTVY